MSKEFFSPEQADLIIELMKIVLHFKYIDPSNPPKLKDLAKTFGRSSEDIKARYKSEFADFSSPSSMVLQHWHFYFANVTFHGKPSNEKGTKQFDTTVKRRTDLKRLSKLLGHQPTGEDFKKTFELPDKFDEICQIIDEDIKNLNS